MSGNYKPPSWCKKIDFIKDLLVSQQRIVSVLGDGRSGKTTFAQWLCEALSPVTKTCLLTCTRTTRTEDLAKKIAQSLKLPLLPLDALFSALNQRQERLFLVIDAAETLTPEALTDLLNAIVAEGEDGFIHLGIFSDFSMVDRLESWAIAKKCPPIMMMEMGCLSRSETNEYILHRLKALEVPSIFISEWDEKTQAFYEKTEGDLTLINAQLTRLFNTLPKRRRKALYKRILQSWQRYMDRRRSNLEKNLTTVSVENAPLVAHNDEGSNKHDPIFIEKAVTSVKKERAAKIIFFNGKRYIQPLLSSLVRRFMYVVVLRQKLYTVVKSWGLAGVSLCLIVMLQNISAPIYKSYLAYRISSIAAIGVLKPIRYVSRIPAYDLLAKRELVTLPKAVVVRKPAPKDLRSRYTIQLLASDNQSDLKRFIAQHPMRESFNIHLVRRGNSHWYILTLGGYKDFNEARRAMQNLPGALVTRKPWVRSLSDIG